MSIQAVKAAFGQAASGISERLQNAGQSIGSFFGRSTSVDNNARSQMPTSSTQENTEARPLTSRLASTPKSNVVSSSEAILTKSKGNNFLRMNSSTNDAIKSFTPEVLEDKTKIQKDLDIQIPKDLFNGAINDAKSLEMKVEGEDLSEKHLEISLSVEKNESTQPKEGETLLRHEKADINSFYTKIQSNSKDQISVKKGNIETDLGKKIEEYGKLNNSLHDGLSILKPSQAKTDKIKSFINRQREKTPSKKTTESTLKGSSNDLETSLQDIKAMRKLESQITVLKGKLKACDLAQADRNNIEKIKAFDESSSKTIEELTITGDEYVDSSDSLSEEKQRINDFFTMAEKNKKPDKDSTFNLANWKTRAENKLNRHMKDYGVAVRSNNENKIKELESSIIITKGNIKALDLIIQKSQ